ncbi:NAD(P)-binding domain-containing protein [Streptomyces sp. NPDC026672]|uniref:NADPH-dependent F420 reductase n=1 Tax=unclassified Streptomyces TaxID=2593676 RepID=UPI0033DB4324
MGGQRAARRSGTMRMAIIGSGNVGRALGRAAVRAGHEVTLSASRPEHAAEAASETGADAAEDNRAAVAAADVIVLAVPGNAAVEVADEIASAVAGKTVIDATNPLNGTFTDLIVKESSAAQEIQRHLPGAAVVKAFNTVFAARHGDPEEDGVPLDALYAGDDTAAKETVAALAESLGYRPVDAGGLRMARALEEMAFLNITLNARGKLPWRSGWKLLGPIG